MSVIANGERIVSFRVGVYRTRFHVRADCPSLTGKRKTVDDWAAVPEAEARALDLTPCQRCEN